MKHSLSKIQFILYALLLLALTGCGANSTNTSNSGLDNGQVTAKLTWADGKTAKTVESTPAGVATIRLKVTGAGIPNVKQDFAAASGGGTVQVYPGSNLIVTAQALDATGTLLYEGYAANVTVTSGATTDVGTLTMTQPTVKATDTNCLACHDTTRDKTGQNIIADYKQSGHYTNNTYTSNLKYGSQYPGCAGCHGTQHNDPEPGTSGRCYECHGAVLPDSHLGNSAKIALSVPFNCDSCHKPHNTKQFIAGQCIACHSVAQNANNTTSAYVNDNNGVRTITTEFSKWSHHVTGVTLNDAHCAACHLEGKITADTHGNVLVAVDTTKHMSDAKTHLRNADTDADFAWDPANPSFSTLDNFCLSCHDSNGATSPVSVQIQAFINSNNLAATGKTASATNPFGDTISNQYDKMQRPAVVDAKGQFNAGNNSHHAVLGKKYSGRTRVVGARQVNVAAFTANSSAAMPGTRSTIYDAGKFNATYVTLADAAGESSARNGGSTLGDDSTLHCADCHTVGQYRLADVSSAAGSFNKAVIGAHGSNNEYLLRNNAGTDARHIGAVPTTFTQDGTQPYLVCFNCHIGTTYGGQAGTGHGGEHDATNDCNGPYNTFGNYTATGTARLDGRTTAGKLVNLPGYGNIFGIQCANCHNSGADNGYGGIHGSKVQTYTDGMGNTSKHIRFMPGLSNVMFVPGTKGGFTGGTQAIYKAYSSNRKTGAALGYALLPVRNTPYVTGQKAGSYSYTTGGVSNDLNWEQRVQQSIAGQTDPVAGAMGCYTLGTTGVAKINALATAGYPADDVRLPATDSIKAVDGTNVFGNWGACDDHNAAQGKGTGPTRNALRPVTY